MPDWLPVALAFDLAPGTAAATRLGPTEVAIWRGQSGRAAAWVDRCPHRGMRLSQGFVRGDWLSCLYHGWRFDGDGRCRKIPAHPDLDPPATIRATALACLEAGGVVWIAESQPATPPPDLQGAEPLRSLAVEAPAGALAAWTGGTGLRLTLAAGEGAPALILLLQPLGEDRTAIHALAAPGDAAARVAASRRLEDLRRRVEAAWHGEAA